MGQRLTRSLESAIRKEIDLILINLGWNVDESDKDCIVFTERAKTVKQNKKLKGHSPDYVLYKSKTDEPIAIIEAKRKGQNIDHAIKQAKERYAEPLGIKIIFAYNGAFFKSWHIGAQKELIIDGITVTQMITENQLRRFLIEGYSISEVTPKTKHSRSELISIFKWANDLLRKEGLREGIERFTEFANILFLKLINELEYERERVGEPRILEKQYSWGSFYELDPITMMNYINDTVLPHLVETYNDSGDVFQEKLLIRNPKTLSLIVERLSSVNLMDSDSDVKGDAFEYFLKNSITVGNDLGEYFTPRHLVWLMIELIEPKFGETIYDPTCGTGGFLIASFNYIKNRCANTPQNNKILRDQTVYGRELTNTAKIAKMNMILTGDGHTNIKQMDSLENPVKEKYGIVLANPPYGQQTDYGDYYPIPSNNGDAIFIQHIYLSLKEGGRAAVVVPEGLLFRSDMLNVRKFLLRNCDITGIISLPQGVFRPYASNKTNIIIFNKEKKGTKSIWFYNMEADGFDVNSDLRRPVDENDIPDLLSKWVENEESTKSWIADIETIKAKDYDLLAKTYEPRESEYKEGFVEFSTILTHSTQKTVLEDKKIYKQITVKWYGKGAVLRRQVEGKKIKTKNQFVAKTGDVIISKIDARMGALAVVPDELDNAIVSSDFPLFKVDQDKVNGEYLDYCLRYGKYDEILSNFIRGTTKRRRVRIQDIMKLTIYLPDKNEQELIVERIKRQEELMKKSEEVIKLIRLGLVDESDFNGEWEQIELEKLCVEIGSGGTPPRSNLDNFKGNIPWVKISDMNELDYTVDTEEKITQEALKISSAKIVPEGTVIFSIFATIGKVSILSIDACTNQAIAFLKPDKKKILSEYLMYYLYTLKLYYTQKARGVAQKNINQKILKNVKIPVPSLPEQEKIVNQIKQRKKAIIELEKVQKRSTQIIKDVVKDRCGVNYS